MRTQLRTTYWPLTHTDHYALKKKTTTTAFLICNRVDLNPYSHDIAFDPQSFRALSFKFQVCLMDLCQSDIQVLYGLQIDNGTQQFVNSSCT